MELSRRAFAAAVLATAGGGAAAGGVLASDDDDGPNDVPVEYADEPDALPDPSEVPAVGVTLAGVYVARGDGWEGPLPVDSADGDGESAADGGSTPTPEGDADGSDGPAAASATYVPPAGVEVVDPADGYDALQGVLDEYGHEPVTVLLTAGTVTVDTNLTVPSNTWLRGVGRETVITVADGTTFDVSGVVRIPKDMRNVVLSDFVIDGNRENVTNEGHEYGFYTKDADMVHCERLVVRNCPGYGFDPHAGEMWETTTNLRIVDCAAVGNGKDGITLAGVEDAVVRGCVARENDRYGVNVTDPDCRSVTVADTVCAENGDAGVVVHNGPRFVTVANNRIHDNGGEGIKVSTVEREVSHCSLVGNAVFRNGRYGVAVLRAHDVAVVGNNLRANATEEGNAECTLGAGDGWAASDCLVLGNAIHATDADYGIDEEATEGTPNVLLGNAASGAAFTNVNRRNPETRAAFNVGTRYRASGTVTVNAGETRARIRDTPHDGHDVADVQVTPTGPLAGAGSYWVETAEDGYDVVTESAPEQSVDFAFAIDSRD